MTMTQYYIRAVHPVGGESAVMIIRPGAACRARRVYYRYATTFRIRERAESCRARIVAEIADKSDWQGYTLSVEEYSQTVPQAT